MHAIIDAIEHVQINISTLKMTGSPAASVAGGLGVVHCEVGGLHEVAQRGVALGLPLQEPPGEAWTLESC